MQPAQAPNRVVTPEAVPLELDVAGAGSRAIALIIDTLIQVAALIGVAIVVFAGGVNGLAPVVVFFAFFFAVYWGYFTLFEGLWNGQTPGKRSQRLRVVRADGHPAGWPQYVIRNLVRVVDFLPVYYMLGVLVMLITKRSQRLGDLAAGTIVVREAKTRAPAPLTLTGPHPAAAAAGVDTMGLTEAEYSLIRSFLERRHSLSLEARSALAAQIASQLRPHVRSPEAQGLPDEHFLEAVARSYQGRFAPPPGGGFTV